MQPGDVKKTWADVSDLFKYINYEPKIGIKEGLNGFVNWFIEYYDVNIDTSKQL